jgi:hypothetical protein
MSAAKRRVKRKIAMLVRMDATASRMVGGPRWYGYWLSCVNPLCARLRRGGAGQRADAALDAALMRMQYGRGRLP